MFLHLNSKQKYSFIKNKNIYKGEYKIKRTNNM